MYNYLPAKLPASLRRLLGLVWLTTVALLITPCTTNAATNFTVFVSTNTQNIFSPNVLNIKAGDTVTWMWLESGHNLVCDNPFNSGTRDPFCGNTSGTTGTTFPSGTTLSFTYLKPGLYRYYCNPHKSQGMTGAVSVASSPSAAVLTNFTILSSQPQFLIQTTIYHTNLVQASTNLTNWVTLLTNVPTTNSFLFTDQTAVSLTNRFYRVFQP